MTLRTRASVCELIHTLHMHHKQDGWQKRSAYSIGFGDNSTMLTFSGPPRSSPPARARWGVAAQHMSCVHVLCEATPVPLRVIVLPATRRRVCLVFV